MILLVASVGFSEEDRKTQAKVRCKAKCTVFRHGGQHGAPGYHFFKVPDEFDGWDATRYTVEPVVYEVKKRAGFVYAIANNNGTPKRILLENGWEEVEDSEYGNQFGGMPALKDRKVFRKYHPIGVYTMPSHQISLLID